MTAKNEKLVPSQTAAEKEAVQASQNAAIAANDAKPEGQRVNMTSTSFVSDLADIEKEINSANERIKNSRDKVTERVWEQYIVSLCGFVQLDCRKRSKDMKDVQEAMKANNFSNAKAKRLTEGCSWFIKKFRKDKNAATLIGMLLENAGIEAIKAELAKPPFSMTKESELHKRKADKAELSDLEKAMKPFKDKMTNWKDNPEGAEFVQDFAKAFTTWFGLFDWKEINQTIESEAEETDKAE